MTEVLRGEKLSNYRCSWAVGDPDLITYHDTEWGVPVHNDRLHFEFLLLEGAQAGLSWLTILHRREAYRAAFHNFDPGKVAAMDPEEQSLFSLESGIIRNHAKVRSAIHNARAFCTIQERYGSFDSFIWTFVEGSPIVGNWEHSFDIPSSTKLSDRVSTTLRAAGFSFVGSTICYSHMQACGLVNDHVTMCPRFRECF
ncbi:MAG: DNA-3-methyladenine glycosylase I [Candidatus Dormibacteria bacterium]